MKEVTEELDLIYNELVTLFGLSAYANSNADKYLLFFEKVDVDSFVKRVFGDVSYYKVIYFERRVGSPLVNSPGILFDGYLYLFNFPDLIFFVESGYQIKLDISYVNSEIILKSLDVADRDFVYKNIDRIALSEKLGLSKSFGFCCDIYTYLEWHK